MLSPDEQELKVVVTRTLEKQGILDKMRAEMRAAVCKVIDEEDPSLTRVVDNPAIQSQEGLLLVDMIHDFFIHAGLQQTKCVLEPETNVKTHRSRQELYDTLQLNKNDTTQPALLQLLSEFRVTKEQQQASPRKPTGSPGKLSPLKPKTTSPKPASPTKSSLADSLPLTAATETATTTSTSPSKESISTTLDELNAKIDAMEQEDSTGTLAQLKEAVEKDESDYGSSDFEEEAEEVSIEEEDEIASEMSNSFAATDSDQDKEVEAGDDALKHYDYIEPAEAP